MDYSRWHERFPATTPEFPAPPWPQLHGPRCIVTICVDDGLCLFGEVQAQTMILNPLGEIAESAWERMTAKTERWKFDTGIVMPNHAHALLWIVDLADPVGPIAEPSLRRFGQGVAGTLSVFVGNYKALVTGLARERGLHPPKVKLWQDNFYDRIVRNDEELEAIRDYIRNNPAKWDEDCLHPNALPNKYNRRWKRSAR